MDESFEISIFFPPFWSRVIKFDFLVQEHEMNQELVEWESEEKEMKENMELDEIREKSTKEKVWQQKNV